VNRFATDTDKEIDLVRRIALENGAFDCAVSELWRYGSKGGVELAKAVVRASESKSAFKFLYPLGAPIKEKIETIARNIYGASSVRYEGLAEENIALYERMGLDKLPICMAKTHLSLSHDPAVKGAPRGFVLPVRDIRPSAGAGFLYALCGDMRTMPSLPSHPVGEKVDMDARGRVKGLF
jgi:formyltetrahydrofolate synthetase